MIDEEEIMSNDDRVDQLYTSVCEALQNELVGLSFDSKEKLIQKLRWHEEVVYEALSDECCNLSNELADIITEYGVQASMDAYIDRFGPFTRDSDARYIGDAVLEELFWDDRDMDSLFVQFADEYYDMFYSPGAKGPVCQNVKE